MKFLKTFESHSINEKVNIDLKGPDGNVFALMRYAKDLARQLDYLNYKEIQKEMISGDYDNAISVFLKYFGDYVNLIGYDEPEEEYESIKESVRSMWDSLLPEQIKWIENNVLPIDDLDEAMSELQEVIVQTDDGGICGVYFSKYDDANEHWASSTKEERMEDVKGYLELEESYDKLKD